VTRKNTPLPAPQVRACSVHSPALCVLGLDERARFPGSESVESTVVQATIRGVLRLLLDFHVDIDFTDDDIDTDIYVDIDIDIDIYS
jgi:hypothetical protein